MFRKAALSYCLRVGKGEFNSISKFVFRSQRNFSAQNKLKFNYAVELLKTSPTTEVNNETMLKLYSLFKQATVGDCNIPKPGMFDVVARTKYDAWKSLAGMMQEEAMLKYTQEVEKLLKTSIPEPSDNSAAEKAQSEASSLTDQTNQVPKKKSIMESILFPRRSNVNSFDNLSLETLLTNTDTHGRANLILNRPKRGNALNMQMWVDFHAAFNIIAQDSACKVVILSGSGSNFCTGMDLEVCSDPICL
jgi:peroxisomal 3,2-trans-enoyl-CoA isomerase